MSSFNAGAAFQARPRKQALATWLIEGKPYTMPEIAARLGITVPQARTRHANAVRKPGAITWESLGLKA